ncbi:MAG: hypothetical protein ABIH72_01045 [archaeon]
MDKEVLKPYGSLDVLYFYSKVARANEKFLRGKELATKTLLPRGKPFFIKRGTIGRPLYIHNLRHVDKKMLQLRAEHGLEEVKNQLNYIQTHIWYYFIPRKLIHFFYACNHEGIGRAIDRVFIDIDRSNLSPEDARKVALSLVKNIKKDEKFNKMLGYKTLILWTGSSFHVYLLLKNKIRFNFYAQYLSYGEEKKDSFLMKWAKQVTSDTKISVQAGHEKKPNMIIIDSSGTPSGKLARVPFSLHMKSVDEVDGVCVPVSQKELEDKGLVKRLQKLTPELVLKNLKKYENLLNS